MKKFCSYLLLGLMRLLGKLPLRLHYLFGDCLAWFACKVLKYRKKVVTTNIAGSFPDKTQEEREEIAKKFYRHLGEIFAEAVWFAGCRSGKRLRKQGICIAANPEEHVAAFREMNGMMVLCSHFGNWELLGGWKSFFPEGSLEYTEDEVTVVYKKLSSEVWDRVMAATRSSPLKDYKGYIESRRVLRYVLEHRGEKKVYLFPTDQYPYKGAAAHGIGEFLHQDTMAMTGGAAMASKLGMGVVYLAFKQASRGHYRAELTTICDNASGMAPEAIMREYYNLLQRDIEQQPWNYLWSHKRWKNLYNYKNK